MKNRYSLFIPAVSLLMIFSGCEKDFLDTKIDTFETPATIATDRGSLFRFADAFYADLPDGFSALDGNFFAAAGDDAQQTAKYSTDALIFNQGGLNPNSINMPEGSGFYKKMYDGIHAANFFLDYSEKNMGLLSKNRDTVRDQANYDRDKMSLNWYRGEAHIVRAFYYAQLAMRYGGVPLITKTLEKSDQVNMSRSAYEEIVGFIVSEIDNYKDSLQVNWKASSFADQDGRFSLGAALAVKANVLLYAASPLHNPGNDPGKWQQAAAAAHEVIALGQYSLDPDYAAYFIGNNALKSDETIFAVRRPAGSGPESENYPISTPGGKSGVTPTQNLVAAYEHTGMPDPANPYAHRDPRLAATVVVNGSNWNGRVIDEAPGGSDDMNKPNTSTTGYYLRKFLTDNLNLVQGGQAAHTWIVYRYAGILLDYAEAMNEAYGPDDNHGYSLTAREALEMVRNRASTSLPPVAAASKDDFRAAVHRERRVELAFEGKRYWDLLRWKEAMTVLNKPVQGVRVTKKDNGDYSYAVVEVADRVFKEAMYYYPFSHSEIVKSNGALVQNPNY